MIEPTGSPSDPQQWRHLAEALSGIPDAWRRLLAEHRECATGTCCACTEGGTGARLTPWPCSIHKLASLAQQIHDTPLRGRPG